MIHAGEPLELLDVRGAERYASGHLAGARSVAFHELGNASFPSGRPLVLYCSQASCGLSSAAAEALRKRGYPDVRILEGGFEGAASKGLPVERAGAGSARAARCAVSPEDLMARFESGSPPVLIDLRPEREFGAGHIPGAWNIPLARLEAELGGLSASSSDVVFYDRLPERSQRALKAASSAGLGACELDGGLAVWAAQGRPLDSSP